MLATLVDVPVESRRSHAFRQQLRVVSLLADGRKRHKVLIKLQETGNSTRQPHHHERQACCGRDGMDVVDFECL